MISKIIKDPFERMQKGAVTVLCVLLMVSGCKKTDTENNDIYLKNLVLIPCREVFSKSTISIDNGDTIKFLAVNNTTLKVEHRITLNCCAEFGIVLDSEENKITISITDGTSCNCACTRIISYEIDNLQENNTYELIFLTAYAHFLGETFYEYTSEYYTYELFFTNQVDDEIPVVINIKLKD